MGKVKEMYEHDKEVRLNAQVEMMEKLIDDKQEQIAMIQKLEECLNEIRMGVSQIERVTASDASERDMQFRDLNDWIDEAEKALK